MIRRFRYQWRMLSLWLFILLGAFLQLARAEGPAVVDLGGGQFQMGEILIDKSGRWFSVSGSVIRDYEQSLLEYFAVKKGGQKAYEAVVDLNTSATEFNVACILIGLDAGNSVLPQHHFDTRPVEGDRVEVIVEWGQGDGVKRFRAEEIFLVGGKPVEAREWVYTGSVILPDQRYLAEEAGTLIGFIHDQDSIIEHRAGIGLGDFSRVEINKSILPPVGTPIRLIVRSAVAR